jgi:ankyrin repeat protein
MSENCAPAIRKQIAEDPSTLEFRDDEGWMALHHEALGGNLAVVKVLLEAGADRHAKTNDGRTPLDLAKSLRWEKVIAALTA